MTEIPRLQSVAEMEEQEITETLKERGGIVYREEKDPETEEVKRFVNVLGVEVETYASEEDIEQLKKEMVLSEVDQELLKSIAESYKLRQALLFEGEPGVGKTFLMKKFVELVHGKDAPILELYGTPRTSELEILGHWSPKGLDEEQTKEYKQLLEQAIGGQSMQQLREMMEGSLSELNGMYTGGELDEEEFRENFGKLTNKYVNESRDVLFQLAQLAGFSQNKSEWEFQEGALLKAYAGNGGRGYILIVDEFNIIPSNYQQIFLQIGGSQGALSDSISFWGNSGKSTYKRGEDTWIAFASNFPEKTPGRSEVVAPMSDRLVWKTIAGEQVAKKKENIIKTAGGRLKGKTKELSQINVDIPSTEQLQWDEVLDEKLGEELAEIIYMLDNAFTKHYAEVGDSISINGQKRRRTQQMEFSGRNALRLFSYLDNFQVRDKETGQPDFAKTLENAFKRYYVDRLADPEAKEKVETIFEQLVRGPLGARRVRTLVDNPEYLRLKEKLEEALKSGKDYLEEGSKVAAPRRVKEENWTSSVSAANDRELVGKILRVFLEQGESGKTVETTLSAKPKAYGEATVTREKYLSALVKQYLEQGEDVDLGLDLRDLESVEDEHFKQLTHIPGDNTGGVDVDAVVEKALSEMPDERGIISLGVDKPILDILRKEVETRADLASEDVILVSVEGMNKMDKDGYSPGRIKNQDTGEYTEKGYGSYLSRLKDLLDSGVDVPVIITSWFDQDNKLMSGMLSEIAKYPNVVFRRLPFSLEEFGAAIEEIKRRMTSPEVDVESASEPESIT